MFRDERLRGLTSDHHHALVLARTIRRQFSASSVGAEEGLLDEARQQFEEELAPHFAIEEEVLLPALRAVGEQDLADRTRREHAVMRELLRAAEDEAAAELLEFAEALEAHVRFEERTVFPVCEIKLDGAVLEQVAQRRPPPRRRGGQFED
jgi:hemerythrin-like domain-containing protein